MRALVIAVAVAVVLSGSTLARAQQNASSAAEDLFNKARELMQEGNYHEACPKLAQSQRLAPAVGTALNLGLCYEKLGRTASAWASYREAVALAEPLGAAEAKRLGLARERAEALEPKVSRLTLRVARPDVAGLEIRRDDSPLERSQWGTAAPLDPEEHVIVATAPGHRPWHARVRIASEGSRVELTIPDLEEAQDARAPADRASSASTDRGLGTRRVIALGVGGAGVVALAVSVILGLDAKSKYDEASSHCDASGCDATGASLEHSAVARGDVATVFGVLGVIAAGAGAVLWFTAPSASGSASIGATPAGLVGAF